MYALRADVGMLMDKVWIVGQVIHRAQDGVVLWRKLGTFTDKAMAAAWARFTKADLLLDAGPDALTPAFGELAMSTITQAEAREE